MEVEAAATRPLIFVKSFAFRVAGLNGIAHEVYLLCADRRAERRERGSVDFARLGTLPCHFMLLAIHAAYHNAGPESMSTVPPGEGERRAQRGYVRQYEASAAAFYAALDRDDLVWVGLADRSAGIADDIVLGSHGRVTGHQFKFAKYPGRFNLETLFCGAGGVLQPLALAWRVLAASFPTDSVEVWFVTNDYPSSGDTLIKGPEGHSAAFLQELARFPTRSLAEWQSSRWHQWIDKLCGFSRLNDQNFEQFLNGLRVFSGGASDFLLTHRLSPEGQRLAETISRLLPKLVADSRDQDRWTRAQLL
jgi:hypothetical protein